MTNIIVKYLIRWYIIFVKKLIVYLSILILVFWQVTSLIYLMTISEHCYLYAQFSSLEENTSIILGLVVMGELLLIPVLGFMCKLPGAFYASKKNNNETLN